MSMRGGASCGSPDDMQRLQAVVEKYCTCGWLSPLRVGKPECDAHAVLASQSAVARLVGAYHARAHLLHAEFSEQ